MERSLLHYKTYRHSSASEWVVFLHGAGGSTATWKYQLDKFRPLYNVLLLDLRDHGRSKNIKPEFNKYCFDTVIDDITDVMNQLAIDKAHFVTLSFGSVLLQYLSIKHPAMVSSAIFAGGIFKANYLIKGFVQLARVFNYILPYKWMYSIFSYLLMPRKSHQKARIIYQKQAAKLTPGEYMKWVGLYSEFFDLLENFFHQKIDFPAMVVMGREDYIFLRAAKKFSSIHLSVSLVIINGAGHICNIDQPHHFNILALDFLKNNSYLEAVLPTINAQ